MKLNHTIVSGVTLHKVCNSWQHKDCDNRQVGPVYKSQAEALADTNDYVKRAGWMPADDVAPAPIHYHTPVHVRYNTTLYPFFVAHHGNWDIYKNLDNNCAAIAIDGTGCVSTHFGDMNYVTKELPRKFGINLEIGVR